jgi:hypothetical protein
MVDVFDEKSIIGVPTGFQQFFGAVETGAKTLFSPNAADVDIDIMRGNERLGALVHRGMEARPLGPTQKNTNTQKFSNFSRVFPLGEEEGDLDANQLLFRQAGENPYAQRTRAERLRALALDNHQEHVRRFVRMFEHLCSLSILTGKMPAILGTAVSDLEYDFQRRTDHIVTVANAWDSVSADIFGDLGSACEKIRANGHVNPDMVIVGDGALDAFLKDDEVSALADNRRFQQVEVRMGQNVPAKFDRFVAGGLLPRGRLQLPNGYELWVFTYNDVFTNDAGSPEKYMPADEALVCYSGARCDRYFGPPERLPMTASEEAYYQEFFGFSPAQPPMPPKIKGGAGTVSPAMFYFDAYKGASMKNVTIRTQTAPIFATTMTDAFVTLQGLTT